MEFVCIYLLKILFKVYNIYINYKILGYGPMEFIYIYLFNMFWVFYLNFILIMILFRPMEFIYIFLLGILFRIYINFKFFWFYGIYMHIFIRDSI